MAILLVMIFHMTFMRAVTNLDSAAQSIFSCGWIGVDLFFVLSGFLITGILFDTKDTQHYFLTFYARRALRIFPLYYAVVAFSFLVLPAIASHLGDTAQAKLDRFGTIEGDQWMYWTYLSNFAIAHAERFRHGILDVSWSLAIEEQFYLIWPTIVFFCSRRTLIRICIGAIVFALAYRCWLYAAGAHWLSNYVLTPARIDTLAVGALIALTARGPSGLSSLARFAGPVALLCLTLLAGDAVWRFATSLHNPGGVNLFSADLPELRTVGYSIIAILFGAVLVLALEASRSRASAPASSTATGRPSALVRLFESPLLRSFGKYSYAMYLFHLPIRAVPRDLIFNKHVPVIAGSQIPAQLLFTIVCIALTFAAAWLSWHLYEKHWLALKRFVEYR